MAIKPLPVNEPLTMFVLIAKDKNKGIDMISRLKSQHHHRLMAPVISMALMTGVIGEVQAMSKKPSPPPPPTAEQMAAAQYSVHDLAQGCYAIQSPANGKFMNRFDQGGLVDNGLSYQFKATSAADAARFYFKPTSYFHYMLTDQDGRYLASHLPNEVSAGRYAGKFAQWRVGGHYQNDGSYRYSFHGIGLNKILRHNYGGIGWYANGGAYVLDILNPTNANSETGFNLVAQNDCKPFPEADLNVDESVSQTSDVNLPVRGAIDPHTHITSYEFMGGKFLHGEPFSPWGIETALRDSKEIHGPSGALDLIGNLMGFNDVNHRYDTRGYPDFPEWPARQSLSHMQYYYKWVERAHKGGLKMMVSLLVENEVLCNVQKTINPASWINPNNCQTSKSIDLQIQRLNEMEAYIDAQQGGPGEGFFRLVSTPAEARQVIADGKMAILMGIEASELFDCGIRDHCTKETIEAQLQKVYNAGVRTLYPTHRFDNQFGGARQEDGFINVGQWLATGRFFETETCDAETRGRYFKSGFPLIGDVPVIKDILNLIGLNPVYDESQPLCNQYGLSDLGVYLVNRMIDMGMIIEMDHMSTKTANAVMEIVQARNYSGVISGHSWLNSAADGSPHAVHQGIATQGGILAPYNSPSTSLKGGIDRYLALYENTAYLKAVPFSTDMGGIGNQAPARSDAATNPLLYPFITEEGIEIDKQVTGNRTFDLNNEGLAHYGLVADHIQDIREQTPARIYDSVMNSAEAYLQMWERAESNNNTQYVNPNSGQ
jgi:microsomal dipeptidase-like Zn-dependent dipeptidase